MRNEIKHQTYDAERSLYYLQNTDVIDCTFAGPADGESVLKEARNVSVIDCKFSLRYPLWHVQDFSMIRTAMDDKTRASIWYATRGKLIDSKIYGVKCLRECTDIDIQGVTAVSPEFGWRCRTLAITDSDIESEYLLFESRDVKIDNLRMKGKYSFQYMDNVEIANSNLDTKDAFWHSKNVTVRNTVLKGEYLGWFADGLTLIDCEISGTQPLCYCTNLKLINCTMTGTDLSFEYSDVQAEIKGHIDSVKNPRSGVITADSVGEVIHDETTMPCTGEVLIRKG